MMFLLSVLTLLFAATHVFARSALHVNKNLPQPAPRVLSRSQPLYDSFSEHEKVKRNSTPKASSMSILYFTCFATYTVAEFAVDGTAIPDVPVCLPVPIVRVGLSVDK